ncbi:putative Transcriptional regulator [Vibrio coralliirubri]|uniref:LysR family transcriptional regulator n=1 Tax=Vibrio coralliirubri TaxID=1516159 RepID=UPI00063550B8|nr:LysR family transcriptional regulator [Vibrio coralliirubri]CDT63200.1 putative Transcriptional regulator [Vibrio coralliirubri]
MVDLNLLKTFSAIYKTGSVRGASEIMHITSSAVSHALSKLRNEYNNPLFVREGRGLKPTTYAVELYKEVSPHLIALEGTKKLFETFHPETSDRTFFIAGDSDLDLWYYQKLLKISKRSAPNVNIVKYRSENREEIFNNALSMRKADVLISFVNSENRSFVVEQVATDKMVAIANKNHPRVNGQLTLQTFLNEEHVGWSRPDIDRNTFEELIQDKVPNVDVTYASTAAMNLIFMVSESDWLSVIPEYLYDKTKELDLVQRFDLPFNCDLLPLYLINHNATERDMGVQWLKGVIRESFA